MSLLSILICFCTLLQVSLLIPNSDSKPKPVDLAYTCTVVIEAEHQDFKPDDVPVILIHGFLGNKESWHGLFQLIALETKKKVCAVDLRNHGESPWNDEEYDVIAMTEDIRHLMDRIKAHKAIVLGHSLGGRVTVNLALNYPERVEKIIVEDIRANGVPPDALIESEAYIRVLKEVGKIIPEGVSEREAKEKVFQLIKERLSKFNVIYEEDDLTYVPLKCSNGKCRLTVNPVLFDVILRNITELVNESSGRFDRPALFIYGTESHHNVGADESNIKKLFPKAELVAVEGVGHVVHYSKKFSREVIKFINNKNE